MAERRGAAIGPCQWRHMFEADVVLRLDAPRQTMTGFGGAFSEKGWQALSALPPARRQAALTALFGDDGCAFNHCRTPIGGNDVARGWYSYDEVPDDFALAPDSLNTVVLPMA